jgi:unsaturated chondroitin disaccharide hydrolase
MKMKRSIIYLFVLFAVILYSCQEDNSTLDVDKYLDFSAHQVNAALKAQPDVRQMPRYIKAGEQAWSTTGITGWTSGFWPGILWYVYEHTGDERMKEVADKWTVPLYALRDWRNINHDLGFMVFCSAGNGYRLTGNPEYKELILDMANTLATLYNPNAGTILSWPGRRSMGNI